MLHLNLWNPEAGLGVLTALVTAVLLGAIHGITPDEHTWPITFSYSVGSYSRRGGRRAGFLFSLTFTLQRAIASELAYFAMVGFLFTPLWEYVIYGVVGLVMAASGFWILRRGRSLHLFSFLERLLPQSQDSIRYLPLLHGFVAGWGTGAFALIVYTVLAPAMKSPYIAFLPGLLFGLGTMVSQMLLGGWFGHWMETRHLNEQARQYVARVISGKTLLWGGIAFLIAAGLGVGFPRLASLTIETPIRVHNLHHLGIGFVLAVVVLFSIAAGAFWQSLRDLRTHPEFLSESGSSGPH